MIQEMLERLKVKKEDQLFEFDCDIQSIIKELVPMLDEQKYQQEWSHYKFLDAQIRHRLNEITYFFHEEPLETRKCVAFSLDCVPFVAVKLRADVSSMFIFVRSTNERLLISDLFGLSKIFFCLMQDYKTSGKSRLSIFVSVYNDND